MLRATDSLPQPTTSAQAAVDCTPTSFNSVFTGTPSQLLLLVRPWMAWAVAVSGCLPQALFPPHSRNSIRLMLGNR